MGICSSSLVNGAVVQPYPVGVTGAVNLQGSSWIPPVDDGVVPPTEAEVTRAVQLRGGGDTLLKISVKRACDSTPGSTPSVSACQPATPRDVLARCITQVWLHSAPESLVLILKAPPRLRSYFVAFLTREETAQHVQFYDEVNQLFMMEAGAAFDAALDHICDMYIVPGSPREVNLPSRLKRSNTSPNMWQVCAREAQTEVLRLLAADSFPRFLRSTYCRAMISAVLASGLPGSPQLPGEDPEAYASRLSLGKPQSPIVSLWPAIDWLKRFMLIAEMLPSSILVTDAARPGGPIIFANAQFKVMTQYSQGDFLERNCRFLQGADTSMAVVGAIRAAVAAGEVHRTEVLNYKKDGTPFRNYLTLLPVYTTHLDGTNTLTFYIGAQFEVIDDSLIATKQVQHEALLRTLPTDIIGTT